jgi:two-component system OmpR family response regulator
VRTIRKALIIDDDEDALRLCEVSLQMFTEWDVAIAQSADTAMAVARRESPDVILLDVMMPGNDDLAILRRLKACGETARIPVVLMTASDKLGRQRFLVRGAVGLIPKPFDPNTLSEEILQILAQEVSA